ncbi:hypothetical protein BDF19DRAFT_422432 [Syncephalis fuscata]|nr:hypothetical protein BDF19DRAFT_422432 [Syncephalis fuscata]
MLLGLDRLASAAAVVAMSSLLLTANIGSQQYALVDAAPHEGHNMAKLQRRNFDSHTCRLLCLINEERARNNLSILGLSQRLTAAAMGHSNFLGTHSLMSHRGSNQSTYIDRIRTVSGNLYQDPTENIAAGQKSPEEVFSTWMGSQTTNTHVGIGIFDRGGTLYWTLNTGNNGKQTKYEKCPQAITYSD